MEDLSFAIQYTTSNYKLFRGFKYHNNFPNQWIFDEKPGTGRECWNCVGANCDGKGYAMWRGIILGYCENCAKDYDGKRGSGFIGHGVEIKRSSYLIGIDLEKIGNLSDNPDDTMENHYADVNKMYNEDVEYDEDHEYAIGMAVGCGISELTDEILQLYSCSRCPHKMRVYGTYYCRDCHAYDETYRKDHPVLFR